MLCVKADVSAVTLESLKLEDLLQDLCLDCIKPYKYREEKIPSYYSMVVSVSVKVIWSSVHTFEG